MPLGGLSRTTRKPHSRKMNVWYKNDLKNRLRYSRERTFQGLGYLRTFSIQFAPTPFFSWPARGLGAHSAGVWLLFLLPQHDLREDGLLSGHPHTSEGPFSSVSKPIFANKYSLSKAFFEIYKVCTPSHRSKLKIFAKIRQTFFTFLLEFLQKSSFFDNFHRILHRF